MVCYDCESCNFRTKFKGDFKRHLKTKKHVEKFPKIKENDTENEKTYNFAPSCTQFAPILHPLHEKNMLLHAQNSECINNKNLLVKDKNYICENCQKIFSRKFTYKRHISNQTCCKNIDANKIDDINELKIVKKINILEEIETLKNKIEVIENENTKLKKNINIDKLNVYINMTPIKLLNQNYIGNPSLKSIEDYISNKLYTSSELKSIKEGADTKNNSVIAKTINSIILDANKELISNNNITGACQNAIFINDGSARQYIAKGPNEWDYYKDDGALDNIVLCLLDKTIKTFDYHPIFLNKKSRNKIIKLIKSNNDYANEKTDLINEILNKLN